MNKRRRKRRRNDKINTFLSWIHEADGVHALLHVNVKHLGLLPTPFLQVNVHQVAAKFTAFVSSRDIFQHWNAQQSLPLQEANRLDPLEELHGARFADIRAEFWFVVLVVREDVVDVAVVLWDDPHNTVGYFLSTLYTPVARRNKINIQKAKEVNP